MSWCVGAGVEFHLLRKAFHSTFGVGHWTFDILLPLRSYYLYTLIPLYPYTLISLFPLSFIILSEIRTGEKVFRLASVGDQLLAPYVCV